MNLTLNGHPRPNGVIRYPTSQSPNPPNYLQPRLSASSPIEHTCGGFLFRNCVDQEQIGQSQRNEVFDKARGVEHSHYQYVFNPLHSRPKAMEEEPKRKISLSICRSENNFRTPKKKSVQVNTHNNQQSRNKRVKTYAGHPQPSVNLPRSNSNEHRPYLVNMHQMKSSLKPSTIPSSHNSAKKSNLSASRKLKLSLTSNFKSQIQSFPAEERQGFQESLERINFDQLSVLRESEPRGSQQVIDHSFMTQKLANIYEEINEGPRSNIVQYNRIMGTDQWKLQTNPSPAQQISKQEKISPLQWNIEQQQPSNNEPSSELQISQPSQQIVPLKQIGRERRWIGDYAPTIKTFNNSQSKEDQESVVIGRGPRGNQNLFPPVTFQRGSVKDYYKEPSSQQIKRACTSFGAEQDYSTEHEGADKLREWLSHPIEEDLSQMDN